MPEGSDFNPYITYINHGELKPGEKVNERMAMWYELELITDSGPGAGCMMHDQYLPIKTGDLFFRRPGDITHGFAPYSYTAILFDTSYAPELQSYYDLGVRCMLSGVDVPFLNFMSRHTVECELLNSLPQVMSVGDISRYKDLFLKSAHLYFSRPKEYQIYAKSLLLDVLIKAQSDAQHTMASEGERSNVIIRTQHFMDEHFSEQITLETLASRVNMSREHLCRLFKKHAGMPPMEYLQSVRIFHAKHLLIMNSDSVEQIALRCGFSNVNYFYETFKKHTGATPAKYRKNSDISDRNGLEARARENQRPEKFERVNPPPVGVGDY